MRKELARMSSVNPPSDNDQLRNGTHADPTTAVIEDGASGSVIKRVTSFNLIEERQQRHHGGGGGPPTATTPSVDRIPKGRGESCSCNNSSVESTSPGSAAVQLANMDGISYGGVLALQPPPNDDAPDSKNRALTKETAKSGSNTKEEEAMVHVVDAPIQLVSTLAHEIPANADSSPIKVIAATAIAIQTPQSMNLHKFIGQMSPKARRDPGLLVTDL